MSNATPKPHCTVANCARPSQARGYCAPHYSSWHRSQKKYTITCKACGKTAQVPRKSSTTCGRKCSSVIASKASQSKPKPPRKKPAPPRAIGYSCHWCKGMFTATSPRKYCGDHCRREARRSRARSQYTPLRAAIEEGDYKSAIEEISKKVHIDESGCWLWGARLDREGYPIIRVGKRDPYVHRLVIELREGRPLGSQAAHHKCAVPACVNPDHLQPVTERENMAEMLARNSYIRRIRELEFALAEVSPGHPTLDIIPLCGT